MSNLPPKPDKQLIVTEVHPDSHQIRLAAVPDVMETLLSSDCFCNSCNFDDLGIVSLTVHPLFNFEKVVDWVKSLDQ